MSATHLHALRAALLEVIPSAEAPELIDEIRLGEDIIAACAAKQAEAVIRFDAIRRQHDQLAGTPDGEEGRGVAIEVTLARRTSPHQSQRFVAWAKVLTSELPATFTPLREGRTTSWRTVWSLARPRACPGPTGHP